MGIYEPKTTGDVQRNAFNAELARRLANDLMDAIETVSREDPGVRIDVLDEENPRSPDRGTVAAIRVRTQREREPGEGVITLKPGMCSTRIADLIREYLKPGR